MATTDPQERTPVWAVAAAVGAFVICCAGPVLLALLATTGLGVTLARRGAPLVAAVGLVAALAVGAIMWQRRRACACQAPRYASGPEERLETGNGVAPPRRDRAGVP
jgi:hypothetical protein